MNDLFDSIVREARTPERAESVLALVELLYEDYEDDLYDVNNIAARYDSSADAIGEIETLVFKCTFDLFNKIGIHLPIGHIYSRPDFAHDVLTTVLDHIDDYQDYEGLLMCLDAGNPPVIAIADIVAQVHSKPASYYVDYLTDVEDRTIVAIRRALTAKTLADYDDEMDLDPERGAIAARITSLFPQTPLTDIFADGGYNLDYDELVEKAELHPGTLGGAFSETVAIVAAGICALELKEYDYAYGELHSCIMLLTNEAEASGMDINIIQIARRADVALREIFNMEDRDEQA